MAYTTLTTLALLAAKVYAKTDLSGCTTTDLTSPAGASQAWYVPGTGEVCEMLDCGGGRAPPKLDVPGCPQYTGTAAYSPSFLAGYGAGQVPETSSAAAVTIPTSSSIVIVETEAETPTAAEIVSTPSSSSVVVVETEAETPAAADIVSSTTTALTAVVVPSTSVLGGASTAVVTPAVTGAAGNGTAGSAAGTGKGSGVNGTATASGSAVPSSFDSGAGEGARAWVGSFGVVVTFAVLGVVGL